MTSWRQIIYDIFSILKQNFNDKEITLNHIAYWVQVYSDRLLSQHIQKHETEAYLQTFSQVPVLTETPTGRQYIEIPESIYDFDKDNGIVFIAYDYMVDTNAFAYIRFTRTTMTEAIRLSWTSEETPTPKNPYWYRANKHKIYLLGTECISLKFVEVGLYVKMGVPCDLDEEFNFPPELITVLQRQILDLGRFVLQIPRDRVMDADYTTDNNAQIPRTKIISVNEQAAPQQE